MLFSSLIIQVLVVYLQLDFMVQISSTGFLSDPKRIIPYLTKYIFVHTSVKFIDWFSFDFFFFSFLKKHDVLKCVGSIIHYTFQILDSFFQFSVQVIILTSYKTSHLSSVYYIYFLRPLV